MSGRQTDYLGSAELNLDMVHDGSVRGTAGAQVVATTAQAYATLALVEAQQKANEIAERAVEQQRTANLVAYFGILNEMFDADPSTVDPQGMNRVAGLVFEGLGLS